MECTYNGQKYSEKDLNKYLADNYADILKEIDVKIAGIAYNLDNSANTTSNKLIDLHREYENIEGIAASEYIDTPHILGKSEPELLNPIFILENYKKNTIETWEKTKPKPDNLTTDEFKSQLEKDFDEMVLQTDEFSKFSEDVLHSLLYAKINQNEKQFNAILNSLDKYIDVLGEGFNPNRIVTLVNNIYYELNKIYGKNGLLMSEIRVGGIDKFGKVIKGRIDIIGIDKDGNINIYDLKMSTKSYDEWDQVKSQKSEYQLGLYRKLLAHNGFNVSRLSVNLIPIQMNYGDLNTITQKPDFVNITTNPNMNLVNGIVTKNLQMLIDDKITDALVNKSEVEENIVKRLGEALPKYNFRTQLFNDDVDKIIELATKRGKTEFGKYFFRNEILDKNIYVSSIEELEKEVNIYVDELKNPNTKNAKVIQFAEGLKKNIEAQTIPDNILNLKHNPGLVNDIVFNFRQYTDGGWELIDSDILLNAGILGFKSQEGILEFVTFTVNNLHDKHLIDKGYNLLGKFFKDTDSEIIDLGIMDSSAQNIELLKILIVLNEMPELFANNRKLGNIKVFNYNDGRSESNSIDGILKNFNELTSQLGITNNFLNNKIQVLDRLDYIAQILKLLTESFDNEKDQKIISALDSPDFQLRKAEKMVEIFNLFIRNHPEYANLDPNAPARNNKREDLIYNYLVAGITEAKGKKIIGDIIGNPELGVTGAEVKNLFTAPFSYNEVKVNDQGIPTVGLFGGYYFSSPEGMRSDDMKIFTDLIREIHHNIRRKFEEESLVGINKTAEYYKKIGFGEVNQHVIGDSYKHHQNFYRRDSKNNLDPRFMFKNPYDRNEKLSETEREYLKFMLWNMNKKVVKGLSKEDLNTSPNDVMNLPQVLEMGEKYFEVPLIKGTNLSRAHSTTLSKIKNELKNQIKSSSHIFDDRNLTPEQILETEEQKNNYHTMVNPLRISSTRRADALAKWGPEYFETNLDIINLQIAFNYIRETEANKVLPQIHAGLAQLKVIALNQKIDITPQINFLLQRLKSDLFGETLIHEETKDGLKIIQGLKQVQSAIKIGLRPALTIKEVFGGLFRNFSRAAFNVYGENSFKMEHIVDSYKMFLETDNKFTKDLNIIDALNNAFGLVDRDINSIVDRQKYDRTGFLGGTSKWLYSTAIMADHLNRSVLYIAQMKAEGSFEAISLSKEGKLLYDFSKDTRYQEFYKNKNNPNYTSKTFLDQKAAYRIKLDEFIQAGYTNSDGSQLKFGDDLPQVHSPRETNNLKSIINNTYGFYDDEVKPIFGKLWAGILFMNFRNYWSGAKNTWLTKKTDKTDQGEFLIKKIVVNGKEEIVYRKEIYDNAGNFLEIKEVLESSPENDGTLEPVKVWKGRIVEGLYWSLAYTFRDATRLKFDDIKANKDGRTARAKLAMHDILQGSASIFLATLIFMWFKDLLGIDTTDDEIGNIEYALNMSEKTLVNSLKELDPYDAVFGSLNIEPALVSTYGNLMSSAQKVFFGDGDALKIAKRNIKMLELIPD